MIYKCLNCETIYDDEPEERICTTCYEQSVVKERDGRIN